MSLPAICPACDLIPFEKLAEQSDFPLPSVTLTLEELDILSTEQFALKCSLCQLLVDLRHHWLSENCDATLPDHGVDYLSPCGRTSQRLRYTDHSYIGISVDFDSVLANRAIKRPVHDDPLSDRAIQLMKHWITTCSQNHKSCPPLDAPLPKRLVDVGIRESDTLHLVETSGQTGIYAALSHCWGLCRAFLTTTTSLEERKRGFRIEELPGTFRDAVSLTRGLRMRYVWIDSLCIRQDDKEDWEIESAKMAEVYENAAITIGASNAADDAEGFLKNRTQTYLPVDIRSSSSKRMIRIWFDTEQKSLDSLYKYPPLAGRAWTLQEHWMSTRMISFDEIQFSWECAQEVWSEDGMSGLLRYHKPPSVQKLIPDGSANESVKYLEWYMMIDSFTSRAITYETDKLPALSALASRVAQTSGDEYLAGIWRSDLFRGLLWIRQVRRQFRARESNAPYMHTGQKPQRESFIAPSWSWASFPRSIEFRQTQPPRHRIEILPQVQYVDSKVEVPGKNPFGAVDSGFIRLKAPLLLPDLDPEWEVPEEGVEIRAFHRNVLFFPELDDLWFETELSFDYPKEPVQHLYALPIGIQDEQELDDEGKETGEGQLQSAIRDVFGILLSPKEGEPALHERVGAFGILGINMSILMPRLQHAERQVVTIV